MANSETLVDFEGVITFGTIEMLLNRLRCHARFMDLPKPARKRLYSIFVEAVDNIYKYSEKNSKKKGQAWRSPMVSVSRTGDQCVVRAGNVVKSEDVGDLSFKLDRVNQLNDEALKSLYEDVINRDSTLSETGAGLGLITMAMRTDRDIGYNFSDIDNMYSYFEYEIFLKG